MVTPRPRTDHATRAGDTSPNDPRAHNGATGADGGAAEPSWPLTTWQGWHQFVTTEPVTPHQPGQPPRSLEQRLAYHSAFVTIRTPAISQLATQVRTLMILGRHQQATARPSLIVPDPPQPAKRPPS
ncbi:hypothetical protein ABZT02_41450 [Streptomyces sp. NPDC005402]|uniref:hypothetical protein n=1 Tax=Streptomyces sp. NPDC005402 TaxID=3155338 RepID=UPI0033A704A8